jgi:hypothetical protein
LVNSSFVNQHVVIDFLSKLTYLDAILVSSTKVGKAQLTPQTLYLNSVIDSSTHLNSLYLPINSLLQTEYQESIALTTLVSPELTTAVQDYVTSYFLNSSFSQSPSAVFDSYTNNLNFFPSEGIIHVLLFGMYA